MYKDYSFEEQRYLLTNLLIDDDLPTSVSAKRDYNQNLSFAFSAPPILFDIGYKQIEEDFQQSSETKEPKGKQSHKSYLENSEDFYLPPLPAVRKLSLQNENYLQYDMSPVNPYCQQHTILPEEQLMNQLSQVCHWARDQQGSRTVQSVLENGAEQTKEAIFNLIQKESHELIKDRFGNYVFQKIFQKGLESHKRKLLACLQTNILKFSQHCYGCRVVQKAIEYVANKSELEEIILKEIQPDALRIIQNQNGNHVIQKCCQVLKPPKLDIIANKIIENLSTLAFHAYGCRVIQKYLENNKGQPKQKIILNKLLSMAIKLSECQYGNYVMQHIVLHCKDKQQDILNIFYYNLVTLSCNKYASNVIEKTIKSAPEQFKDKLVQNLIDTQSYLLLARNQYGNYVIQSLMEKASKEKRMLLKLKLKENSSEISHSQYGKHVLLQLQKVCQ